MTCCAPYHVFAIGESYIIAYCTMLFGRRGRQTVVEFAVAFDILGRLNWFLLYTACFTVEEGEFAVVFDIGGRLVLCLLYSLVFYGQER